jgi:hypothetical protein
MIRLTLDTSDIDGLLQGKTVIKHKTLAIASRAHSTGVVVEVVLTQIDYTALQGALNRVLGERKGATACD